MYGYRIEAAQDNNPEKSSVLDTPLNLLLTFSRETVQGGICGRLGICLLALVVGCILCLD